MGNIALSNNLEENLSEESHLKADRWEDSIAMEHGDKHVRMWTVLDWLRTRSNDGALCQEFQTFGFPYQVVMCTVSCSLSVLIVTFHHLNLILELMALCGIWGFQSCEGRSCGLLGCCATWCGSGTFQRIVLLPSSGLKCMVNGKWT